MVARILPFTRRDGTDRANERDDVDGWGRDAVFTRRVNAVSRLRWNVTVGGAEHVPARAGALIVVNARRYALAPVYAALAIGDAVDRPVRFVGRPDTAPVGSLMRRLGGLLEHPDEIRTALANKQIVVLGTHQTLHPRHVGHVDHRLVGPAVTERVRVLPAATASSPIGRAARVEIGPAVPLVKRRRGPLAELEVADAVHDHITDLLDELGGFKSGTLLDWMPLSGMGGS